MTSSSSSQSSSKSSRTSSRGANSVSRPKSESESSEKVKTVDISAVSVEESKTVGLRSSVSKPTNRTSSGNTGKETSQNISAATNKAKSLTGGRSISPPELIDVLDGSFSSIKGIALGLIETRGLVPAIEAADAMTKAAEVNLISREFVGGGYVTVMVRGETGAVNASVRAGADACERVGDGLVAAHIIARPHAEVEPVLKAGKRVRRG